MPITLTGLSGPLQGQVFEFGKGKAEITVGRAADCDIRFPAEFRAVSRAHLTIAHENNRYYVRADTAVFVNGREVIRGDALPRDCELRLGAPTGPAFKVHWTFGSDMPSTQAAMRRPLRTNPVRAAMKDTARTRRFALGAVAAVALVVLAAGAYFVFAPPSISERLAAARPSVYLVFVRQTGGAEIAKGTAWVIAPGVFATNAHIVESYEAQKEQGHRVFVRSSMAPYETHEVLSAVAHPQYRRFTNVIGYHAPVAPGGRLVGATLAYDVGYLRVDPAAKLAPALKVARIDTLRALAAGDEIGYVGYPSENMAAGGVNVAQPTPQTHVARVTAVTDFFLAEDDADQRHLIQHSLPGAGGSSGSPVFNARGEVIGLFNAGNVLRVTLSGGSQARIPNILVNFAQRADLMVELMESKPEASAEGRDAVWRRKLAGLPSAPDFLIARFQTETKSTGAKPILDTVVATIAPKADEVTGGAKPAAAVSPVARLPLEIPGPGTLMVIGLAESTYSVFLTVAEAANPAKVLGQRNQQIHYPWVALKPTAASAVVIAVTTAEPKRVRIRAYFVPN